MSYNLVLPFPVGEKRTIVEAGLLGQLFSTQSKVYMLVKITGTIAVTANLFLQFSAAAGPSNSLVDAVTGAAESKASIAGLCDGSQGGVVSGDYILIQRKGRATATTETTALAAQADIATAGTDGKIDDGTVAFDTVVGYTNAAQTSIDSEVEIFLDLP